MRRWVFKLSILTLLVLTITSLSRAQRATPAGPQSFPIIYGSRDDGLPQKLKARGTITRVKYAPPHSCGELIFAATFEVKLDGRLSGYRHPFLYLVVPCLYQPEGAEKFLDQRIEINATKQNGKGRPCFFDSKSSEINSRGVPFYCAEREELLRAIMREPVAPAKESVEFDGTLEKGTTYRALVTREQEQDWRLVAPLKLPFHHAGRVEWLNLKDFPELSRPPSGSLLKRIVFKVVERSIVKVAGQDRWNTTYSCRIITME